VHLSTDFRLGYAPTSRLVIAYDNLTAWYGESGHSIVNGVTDLSASFYRSPSAPSAFMTAGYGFGSFGNIEGGGSSGSGWMAGGGYEFRRHWLLQAVVDGVRITGYRDRLQTIGFHADIVWLDY